MKCPVCGNDCARTAREVIDTLLHVFARCPECKIRVLDKNLPLPSRYYETPCTCGKRFIDEVFAHLYVILVEEEIFRGTEPVRTVGTPLVHPGFYMTAPPFLPANSLILLSEFVDRDIGTRIVKEVPEVRAVVKTADFIPGVVDPDLQGQARTYQLLAGCDIRANVYNTAAGPVVLYLQQSMMHIEFPRRFNPKIAGVEQKIAEAKPVSFVDACCGVGTLGLTAARHGIPQVILNDAWFAAAFFAAFNTLVNMDFFAISEMKIIGDYEKMKLDPVGRQPQLVGKAEGQQEISIYHGDFRQLYPIISRSPVLAAIDVFEKNNSEVTRRIIAEWKEKVPGEVFIP